MSTLHETLIANEDDLIRRTIDAGADYCDLRIEEIVGTGLEVKDDELRKVVPGRTAGALLRALVNGSWGIISFNEETALSEAPGLAVRLARVTGKGEVTLAEQDPIEQVKQRIIANKMATEDELKAIDEMSDEDAAALIMAARAPWFADEE